MKDNKSTEEFYITKFALTSTGVLKIPGKAGCLTYSNCDGDTEYVKTKEGTFFKPNFYKNKEEAIERCNIMKENKIKALKKQLQKLESLNFNKVINDL